MAAESASRATPASNLRATAQAAKCLLKPGGRPPTARPAARTAAGPWRVQWLTDSELLRAGAPLSCHRSESAALADAWRCLPAACFRQCTVCKRRAAGLECKWRFRDLHRDNLDYQELLQCIGLWESLLLTFSFASIKPSAKTKVSQIKYVYIYLYFTQIMQNIHYIYIYNMHNTQLACKIRYAKSMQNIQNMASCIPKDAGRLSCIFYLKRPISSDTSLDNNRWGSQRCKKCKICNLWTDALIEYKAHMRHSRHKSNSLHCCGQNTASDQSTAVEILDRREAISSLSCSDE